MNLEEELELKEIKNNARAWKGLAIAAVLFLAGYAYLTTTTFHEAVLYETYKPAFVGLANGTYKLELNSTFCANQADPQFNELYNFSNETQIP